VSAFKVIVYGILSLAFNPACSEEIKVVTTSGCFGPTSPPTFLLLFLATILMVNKNEYIKNNHEDKRLHGNIQYVQKQPHLLQFLDIVQQKQGRHLQPTDTFPGL